MHKQYTVEVRLEMASQNALADKTALMMEAACIRAARELANAAAKIHRGKEKFFAVAAYSDDWFAGHQDIDVTENKPIYGYEG